MTEQPEALRLADIVGEQRFAELTGNNYGKEAAAELRRLYELNEDLYQQGMGFITRIAELEQVGRQALEALERCVATCFDQRAHEQVMSRPEHFVNQNITALRERLAQPGQEPVAWVTGWHDGRCVIRAANPSAILPIGIALYTTPPRREWVGLTDEELHGVIRAGEYDSMEEFARAIEAKLKEKNA